MQRGETVYIAGLAAPGTHNTGIALIEVTQKDGPRIIVNNEEERFSGNKHTTEYPRASIDAMVETLRQIGRSVGDIAAFVTTWDYPVLIATMIRSALEEAPGSLKLLTLDSRVRPSIAAAWTRCDARREFSPGNSACPSACR